MQTPHDDGGPVQGQGLARLRVGVVIGVVGVLLVVGWSTAVVGLVLGRLDVIVLGTVVGGIGQAGG